VEFLFFFILIWLFAQRSYKRELRKKLREDKSSANSKGLGNRKLLETFGDGMYEVGVDIAPGTYRCPGRAPLETMWQRVSDFSGTEASMIACAVVYGPCIVTIARTDRGFESVNSGGWSKIC
jgi:hypothetical protein